MFRSDFDFPAKGIFHNLAQNVLIISKVITSKTLVNYFYIEKCVTSGEGQSAYTQPKYSNKSWSTGGPDLVARAPHDKAMLQPTIWIKGLCHGLSTICAM